MTAKDDYLTVISLTFISWHSAALKMSFPISPTYLLSARLIFILYVIVCLCRCVAYKYGLLVYVLY